MGLTHLSNLMGIRGVKVAVVADMSLEAAQRGQAIANAERATTEIEGAIAAADVDVVMISTPTTTHAHLLETAVGAGKPVWCEKPIAQDLAGTRRVVELIAAAGLAKSKSEARRLVAQNAVSLDDRRVPDVDAEVDLRTGQVLRVGKRRFGRVVTG